jgi:hypothetical protein
MKTKNLFVLAGALALAAFSTGCATTTGVQIGVASGTQAAGDIYANTKLDKIDKTPAGTAAQQAGVADLVRVGTDLKAFAAGTLSNYELGAIEEQLHKDGVALSNNTDALNQINSVLNIFAHAVTSVSGLVLPAQSQLQGGIANLVSGFQVSIDTHEGRWSVTNPAAWNLNPNGLSAVPAKSP